MSITTGTKLGPYEILSPAGAGGMGEVYRARDTRLDREVAVKVLPAHLSQNPDFRQRFEREARAASSLNHPNICTLHDIGRQDGIDYLVMEYLEGETLAERLEKGPVPVDELLRCAVEVADALDKAHRQGLIHRDLKPGNIMLTKGGAKLLDFGLAKSTGPAPGVSGMTSTPTVASPLTAQGTLVGTFQYMSPEQLEGEEADVRSDIFAFGAVLYEMATGTRAFEGKTQAGLVASILKEEPRPLSSLAPMTPPALVRLIKTCLAKDPDERRQTMHDVLLELKWVREAGSKAGVPVPVAARRKSRERLAWTLSLILAASTITFGIGFARHALRQPEPVRSYVLPAENTIFRFTGWGGPVAVSPDGRKLVFSAADSQGLVSLWIRNLGELSPRPLPGTGGALFPFWSPDSRFVGFFADRKLKKINISGGPPLTLCDATDGRGGTWNSEGVILFTPHWREPIHRVLAAGGKAEPVTEIDSAGQETTHRWPQFLPDGRHFIYLAGTHTGGTRSEVNAIYVSELGSPDRKVLVRARSNPVFAQGHLLFYRDGSLMAQPLDLKNLELTGNAIPIAEGITYSTGFFRAVFSASANGILAYQGGGSTGGISRLVWLDRSGREMEAVDREIDFVNPRLSPDGKRIAVAIGDPADLWLYEKARKVLTRFTFDPALDSLPIWSPDGDSIVFTSWREGFGNLFVKVTTGTGSAELLLTTDELKVPKDWSRDGRFLLFDSLSSRTGWDLWVYSMEEGKAELFLQTEFNEVGGQFSPDGRWVAYSSTESGREEIYVQPFPATGGRWQISNAGGALPAWRRDGKEIFYLTQDGKMISVEVTAEKGFQTGVPRILFETRVKDAFANQIDISPDGQRFLINMPVREETTEPIILVQNWTADLER